MAIAYIHYIQNIEIYLEDEEMINELKVGNVFPFWVPVNLGFA
ncbi:hypothetical protein [Bacillus pseudomycoides]|nr:hypothetical protein [Bacillus pseudomycoides]EEM14061.1 hypothetical protein bpmyx0001_50570 [Bacillus pseudomycoides DSM 12442]MED1599589.1 hypothetical protein [Bacillus pseudomycoides]